MNPTLNVRSKAITAALLVIGDEILSGRTPDANIPYVAAYLAKIGIVLGCRALCAKADV
jgi:molybdopterin-biosynthesis enzyme MoeA-like protein